MPRYLFRLTRQMTVDGEARQPGDGEARQPGDAVPEAASWPNLRHYESLGWLERVPVPDDYSGAGAVEYPPTTTTSKMAEVLQPEREPTPVAVAWSRKTGASGAIRCVNCRVRNWLATDFLETATWMCHACAQPQTIIQAQKHPAPTSLGEWVESFDAAAVDDEGAIKWSGWTPGAGEAAARAAGVKNDGR
jgi:hypothetical protein